MLTILALQLGCAPASLKDPPADDGAVEAGGTTGDETTGGGATDGGATDGGGADGGVTAGDDTGEPWPEECTEEEGLEIYARYIEPVVSDDHPSSCNQCHLSGVDLGMYVQDTPCQTMACMVELGAVDLDEPEASQVLEFILKADPASDLIDEDVIQREYDGFLEWIQWSATCHDRVCGAFDDPCETAGDGEELPEDVRTPLGECDEATLGALFQEKVWDHHGRCWACHALEGASHEDWPAATTFYVWNGDAAESALMTMYNLIGIGAVDAAAPTQSPLVTKPLAEGYTAETPYGDVTGVYHGGGDKFEDEADVTFQDHLDWLLYYAACLE